MAKEEEKLGYALISLYLALYKSKYNKQPTINRYREKWAMKDVIDTVGFDRSKELLEYYFKCGKPGHPLPWFYNNFDKLDNTLSKVVADNERRSMLRSQTKTMVEQESNE